MAGFFWATALGAAAFAGPPAREHVSLNIVYDAPNGCPAQSELERSVAERLGYEPFRREAETTIRVALTQTRNGKSYLGHIEIRKGATLVGERELPGERDCAEVVRAAALMVALAVDPLSQGKPPAPQPSETAPPVPPAPATSLAVAPLPPPPEPERLPAPASESEARFHLQIGVGFSALRLPTAGVMLAAQAGVSLPGWSAALEGRADLPFSDLADAKSGGVVSASTLSLAIVPCLERRYYFGCGVFDVGVLQGTGEGVKTPKRDTSPFFAAGIRGGVQVPTSERFFFRLHAEVLAPVTRTTLSLNGAPVWTTPTVNVGVGLAAGRRF